MLTSVVSAGLGCHLAHGRDVEEGRREGGNCCITLASTPGAGVGDPRAAPLASHPFPQEALLRERSSSSEEKVGRQGKEDGGEKSQERQTDGQTDGAATGREETVQRACRAGGVRTGPSAWT